MVGDGHWKVNCFRLLSNNLKINLGRYYPEDQSAGDPANTLQKGSVNVWKNSDCQKSFSDKGSDIILSEKQICAGYVNGGIDSCWVSELCWTKKKRI